MRTKFKDAADLLDYADVCRKARAESLRAYTDADQAWRSIVQTISRVTLPDDMRETPEATEDWVEEEQFILENVSHPWHGKHVYKVDDDPSDGSSRICIVGDPVTSRWASHRDLKPILKPESKPEWIIEIGKERHGGNLVKSSIGATVTRQDAKRFSSEEAAADFAADYWKDWSPRVAPYTPEHSMPELGNEYVVSFDGDKWDRERVQVVGIINGVVIQCHLAGNRFSTMREFSHESLKPITETKE